MTKTVFPKKAKADQKWWLVDAKGKTLGRLAARVARVLRGKDNPTYTPDKDMGDSVVVINAKDVVIKGGNKLDQRFFAKHTGYPSGLKVKSARRVFQEDPAELLFSAISGMLPKTALGNNLRKKLHVYADDKHTHEAQKPEPLDIA